jgi:retron-type reverse transcriptase
VETEKVVLFFFQLEHLYQPFQNFCQMDLKKSIFSSLAQTQLHHTLYSNFIILFLFIYFFHNFQNTFYSHSISLSPSVFP